MTRVSVIVASRERPAALRLCLTAIGRLCHKDFELVVVTDPAGDAVVTRLGWGERVKRVAFDRANLSAARNAGLAVAAGEVVAFIDDDAVPEPRWLDRLTAPFDDEGIAATGGYVIGRNGISLQWGARAANGLGDSVALTAPGEDPFEPAPPEGFATRTEGTNCAFRRAVLARLGGFDPAFRYYLDDTDVNLRLAAAGARTVLVPRALVHHGYAEAVHRAADRAPRDLTEIGASMAVFLRKHAERAAHAEALARFRADQRRRLLRHMVAGGLEPRDVARRLDGLGAGIAAGMARALPPLDPLPPSQQPFLPFRPDPSVQGARPIAGRVWQRRRFRAMAAAAAARGEAVTLFLFSPTALPHQVRFHPGGWWEQTGGLFGPARRDEPTFRLTGFRARAAREWDRVREARQCR